MTPERLLRTAIIPAFYELQSYGIADTTEARRFILAIALQESGLKYRRQINSFGVENGPAASFWQFESLGGCKGLFMHQNAGPKIKNICSDFNIEQTPSALWEAIRYQDIVAACAARLLIYTLPDELPKFDIQGWDQYLAAWRPGKPRKETWSENWLIAYNTVEH